MIQSHGFLLFVCIIISGATSSASAAEVSQWRFNGNAIDSVGGRNGTLLGDAGFSNDVPPGHTGMSLQLDGTLDKMIFDVQTIDALQGNYTVAAWVKPSQSRANGTLTWFGTRFPDGNGFDFKSRLENNSTIRVDIGNGTSFPVISDTVANLGVNAWHHVAVAVQPNQYDLFVDGNLLRHQNFSAFTPLLWDQNHDIAIGAVSASPDPNGPPNGEDFAGLIKNVRVFNTALNTEAQIRPLLLEIPEPSSFVLVIWGLVPSLLSPARRRQR